MTIITEILNNNVIAIHLADGTLTTLLQLATSLSGGGGTFVQNSLSLYGGDGDFLDDQRDQSAY